MKAIIIIIIVLLVLFWLYLLCLRCRRGKMDQAYFRQWRYAHRGLHDREKGIPENSMAAFKRAAANGFGAELDVHLMKDGKLAVIHDASLLRTAGADVEIEDLTAEALEKYPLEGTEQRIPLLEEVLPLFTDRAPLIVELKAERGNAEALAAAASRVLKKYKGAYCVESFDPRCLMWLWQNEPDILRGQLSEDFSAHGDAQHLPGGRTSSPIGSRTGAICPCGCAGASTRCRRPAGPCGTGRLWKRPRRPGTWSSLNILTPGGNGLCA